MDVNNTKKDWLSKEKLLSNMEQQNRFRNKEGLFLEILFFGEYKSTLKVSVLI